MINSKMEKAERLFQKKEVQRILQYANNSSDQWIQYADLRREFCFKYKDWIKRESDKLWYNPNTNNNYYPTSKPKETYEHQTLLLRDLEKMVKYGFLIRRKKEKDTGKRKTYFKLSKEFKREGIRIQNKSAFDIYPLEQIYKIPSKEDEAQHVLYGFSEKMISELENEDKKQLDNEIKKVITSTNKIEKIHDKHRGKKLNELRSTFMKNTSNIKIKKLLKNNYWQFIGCISELIGANYNHRYSIPRKAIRLNIENWIQNVPDISKYNFSKKEITELTDWTVKNHKVFCDMEPYSIAFFRYVDRYDNLLLQYQ